MELLLRLRTGSHLYHLNHKNSDEDWLEVYDKCRPSQSLVDNQDITRWPLSMFMRVVDKGGHNGLEAMFSAPDWPETDLLADLRASYYADPYRSEVRISKAAGTLRAMGTAKGEQRAQMLESFIEQIWETGRFNPHYGSYMSHDPRRRVDEACSVV